jgi:hypothetical protein
MAALDFPTSPANGDKYPVPAVAGLPVYTWDGEKWTTVGGSVISGTPSNALPLMDNTPAVAGAATNYTREDHVHPVDTKAVRSDVATLWTPAQQQLARQNAYAAPFDAMMMGGLQINGGMEVSQELGTTGTATAGRYICDGWKSSWAGAMVLNGAQASASPVLSPGFTSVLVSTVTTAQASLGPSDLAIIFQQIEGLRTARLAWGTVNAQPITIGFWSGHHRTGVYSGSVRNGGATRSYAFTYTQNAADVYQYNIVTIPGDTAGSGWLTDNTTGIILDFAMGCGSNGTAPAANTWQSGSYQAAPGQINAVAATSDVFRITGVIVLPGNEAPSAARSPFVMRSYDQELLTCMRYYRRVGGVVANDLGFSGWGTIGTSLPLTPVMRAAPSISTFGTIYSVNIAGTNYYSSPGVFTVAISASNANAFTQYASNVGGIILDARL